MEEIGWSDRVESEEILHRVKEKMIILQAVQSN